MNFHVILVSHGHNGVGPTTIKRSFSNRKAATIYKRTLYSKLPDHIRADYRVVSEKELSKMQEKKMAKQRRNRKRGAQKAAEARKGCKLNYITCPKCNAKSKKLYSEMGGLQTRLCHNGHQFEWDSYSIMGIPVGLFERALKTR